MKYTPELREQIKSLNLDWEEDISLHYSAGLITYWEAYHSYKQKKTIDTILDFVPVIAQIAIGHVINGMIISEISKAREMKPIQRGKNYRRRILKRE